MTVAGEEIAVSRARSEQEGGDGVTVAARSDKSRASLDGVRFAPVTAELLSLDGLTVNHVRVWCHVWEQTLGRPDWDLSYQQIADATGVSRATVVRSVTWLVERGWMRRTPRRSSAGDHAPSLLTPALNPGRLTDEPTRGLTHEATGVLTREPHQESHHQENHDREKDSGSAAAERARVAAILGVVLDDPDDYAKVWRTVRRYLFDSRSPATDRAIEAVLFEVNDHLTTCGFFPDPQVQSPTAVVLDAARKAVEGHLPPSRFDYDGKATA